MSHRIRKKPKVRKTLKKITKKKVSKRLPKFVPPKISPTPSNKIQIIGGPIIIENPKLKEMPIEPVSKKISKKAKLMEVAPKQISRKTGRNTMPDVPKRTARSLKKKTRGSEFGDQIESKGGKTLKLYVKKRKPESYVRLDVRKEDEKISIVGIKKIDGPLLRTEHIQGNNICEISYGSKCLGISSEYNPDELRSFPNPKGSSEQRVHFIAKSHTYDFHVRIPSSDLSLNKLPRLKIIFYRTKKLIEQPIGPGLIREQFGDYVRPVAELKGIQLNKLPKQLQKKIKQSIE